MIPNVWAAEAARTWWREWTPREERGEAKPRRRILVVHEAATRPVEAVFLHEFLAAQAYGPGWRAELREEANQVLAHHLHTEQKLAGCAPLEYRQAWEDAEAWDFESWILQGEEFQLRVTTEEHVEGLRRALAPKRAAGAIVDKPWGHEHRAIVTDRYAGKILHMVAGCRMSRQMHGVKEETLHVLSGEVAYVTRVGDGRPGETRAEIGRLSPGDTLHIPPGTIHRLAALTHAEILEVSTPELDDVIRLEDDYVRPSPPWIEPLARGCKINPFVSRVCERGTPSCRVRHEATEPNPPEKGRT